MKSTNHIPLLIIFILSIFAATTLISCNTGDDPAICRLGYEGITCKTKSIIGNWKGEDKCDSASYKDITITLVPDVDTNSVVVTNPGGFGPSVVVIGSLSDDARSVTITNAKINNSASLSGTIYLTSKEEFTFDYEVKFAGNSKKQICSGEYTKF